MKKLIFVVILTLIMLSGCTSQPKTATVSAPSTALASCEYDGRLYYITLGDEEGIHKIDKDGDEIISDLGDMPINGSTAVTAEAGDNAIIFSIQQLSQTDENGKAEEPSEILTYKLDLADNSLSIQ